MEVIRLDPDSAWEVTTKSGTRIILDLAGDRWMRIPVFCQDDTLNLTEGDGRWQRLAYVHPIGVGKYDGPKAVLGHRMRIYCDFSEWWTSTSVVAVRRLPDGEIPRSLYGE